MFLEVWLEDFLVDVLCSFCEWVHEVNEESKPKIGVVRNEVESKTEELLKGLEESENTPEAEPNSLDLIII